MKLTYTMLTGILFIALLSSCAFAQGRFNNHNGTSQIGQAPSHQGPLRSGQVHPNRQGQSQPHPNWTQRPPNEKIRERIRNKNLFNGGQGRNGNRGQNGGNRPWMQNGGNRNGNQGRFGSQNNQGNQNTGADKKYNSNWFFGKPENGNK
jgi:hypothetical protein